MPRLLFACAVLSMATSIFAQTADRSAAPPSAATAAPPAHVGTFTVQNGELVVAPGLRIPNGNLPWALDTIENRQVLVPVHHSSLRASAGAANTLAGDTSRTPLRSSTPVFFVHTSDRTENAGDSGRGSPTGWALLPVHTDGVTRTIDRVQFADVNGATVCTAPVLCLRAESLPEGWMRMTPQQPLQAGQYALVPVQRTTPALAYDFTVDPLSPAAKDAVSAGQNPNAAPLQKNR